MYADCWQRASCSEKRIRFKQHTEWMEEGKRQTEMNRETSDFAFCLSAGKAEACWNMGNLRCWLKIEAALQGVVSPGSRLGFSWEPVSLGHHLSSLGHCLHLWNEEDGLLVPKILLLLWLWISSDFQILVPVLIRCSASARPGSVIISSVHCPFNSLFFLSAKISSTYCAWEPLQGLQTVGLVCCSSQMTKGRLGISSFSLNFEDCLSSRSQETYSFMHLFINKHWLSINYKQVASKGKSKLNQVKGLPSDSHGLSMRLIYYYRKTIVQKTNTNNFTCAGNWEHKGSIFEHWPEANEHTTQRGPGAEVSYF